MGEGWGGEGQKEFPWPNDFGKHWTKGSKQVLLIYAFHNLEFADEHCESPTCIIAVVLNLAS